MTNEEALVEIEWVKKNGFRTGKSIFGTERILTALDTAIEALSQPEVIRCKDCKHWRQPNIIINGEPAWSGFCKHMDGVGDPEGFCYRAARGEE